MTDDLIKRVAEKLGWKRSPGKSTHDHIQSWIAPDGVRHFWLPPWLTSIDAALSVLDKDCALTIVWRISRQDFTVSYMNGEGVSDESLPRAILLAFLEAPHDNNSEIVKYSTCCGVADTSVSMDGPEFSDIGICPKCKEHCELEEDENDA